MTACDRFESEGLTRFVAGEALDAHFETCADCRAARASYQALAAALERARDGYTPPGDWEAKVWARIQRGEGARQRHRWTAVLGFCATAAALAVFTLTSLGGPDKLVLTIYPVEHGSALAVRGGGGDVVSAAPGDVLPLGLKVPRGKQGDIRVYRGANELVFQCATSPDCLRVKDGMKARVTLERAGTYRILYIAADKELPPATGSLDADFAAARRSGSAEESPPIPVL